MLEGAKSMGAVAPSTNSYFTIEPRSYDPMMAFF